MGRLCVIVSTADTSPDLNSNKCTGSVMNIFSFNTLGEIVSVQLYRQNVQGKMFYNFIDFLCFPKKRYFDTTFFTASFLYIFEHLQSPPKSDRKIYLKLGEFRRKCKW